MRGDFTDKVVLIPGGATLWGRKWSGRWRPLHKSGKGAESVVLSIF